MADAPGPPELPEIPEAVPAARGNRRLHLVWVIPLVAALVGGWLAIKAILERGPTITISFQAAEGLEAGKTKIRFKDVDIGVVTNVKLSGDHRTVIVTADLSKDVEPMLVEGTRFWVVRPRISGGSVSGLATLLSGSYVSVDFGHGNKPQHNFVGLETPPVITIDAPGRAYTLSSDTLGSLDIGSPIYYRRLQVGQVTGYALDEAGKTVIIKVFIKAPYDRFVTSNTRFWQASGFDLSVQPSGVKLEAQSLVSILIGGVAFETPTATAQPAAAAADTQFSLFASRLDALKNPEPDRMRLVMVFNETVKGLAVGAPLDFRGIEIGNVAAIKIDFDDARKRADVVVEADVFPSRLNAHSTRPLATADAAQRTAYAERLIEHGLRAQLRTSNLLTGQLYIALDFFPGQAKRARRDFAQATEVPTVPSSVHELETTLASLAKKFQDLPLKEVTDDMRQTLRQASATLEHIDTQVTPEAQQALAQSRRAAQSALEMLKPDSSFRYDARNAMREIARAAEAFRTLADYLDRHPEAIIRGKKAETTRDAR